VRRGLAVVLTIVAAGTSASIVHADGDPASDVLPTATVYFPFKPPSHDAQRALTSAVDAVYAHGNRVRVAVIPSPTDLGAIPSLMNKPGEYARFLGQELAGFYVGPLLIVMPKGWGIYDGGRSVSSANDVLAKIGVSGSSVDDLVRSAATAVERLEAAGALKSPDVRPPYVFPEATTLHPGRRATLSFRVLDDSNRTAVSITVVAGSKTLASLSSPLGPTNYPDSHSLTWNVPKTIATKGVKLCMTATDAAGNKSAPSCMPLKVA
jgi:hypothetical protein